MGRYAGVCALMRKRLVSDDGDEPLRDGYARGKKRLTHLIGVFFSNFHGLDVELPSNA